MAYGWYAATSRPLQEERAERELRKQGFRVSVPKVRVRSGRRAGYEVRPYLRGYVLLELDLEVDWWPSVNGTRGVGRLVMTGGIPSRIWAGPRDHIISLCFGGLLVADERELDEAVLAVGDEADVRSGPFRGFSGAVSDVDASHRRIGLLLDILGTRRRIGLATDQVRKAAPPQPQPQLNRTA